MTVGTKDSLTPEERYQNLEALWNAVLKALLDVFKTDQPHEIKASLYSVAIQFLRNNGTSAQSLKDAENQPHSYSNLTEQLEDLVSGESADNVIGFQPFKTEGP